MRSAVIIPESMQSMLSHTPQPSRRLRLVASSLRVLLWLLAALWLLFALGLAILHGWIVPRIDELRPSLESRASEMAGVPIRIGAIHARSDSIFPTFDMTEVTLLDARGEVALRLPRLTGRLSPGSLWRKGFEQLVVERPELDIRRAADGTVSVAGVAWSKGRAGESSAAADWFFSQSELVVQGGMIRWTDELRGLPMLLLTEVDLKIEGGGARHALRLDATPPAEWGSRFGLQGKFTRPILSGRPGDFSQWSGQLFADFGRAEFAQIGPYVSLDRLGVALGSGRGAVRAWADVTRGELVGGTADVALEAVNIQAGRELKALAFDTISGRLGGARRDKGFEVSTENLRFRMPDGLQWPGGNLALTHEYADGARPAQTALKADRLDLAALATIAGRLPLGDGNHALVDSLRPAGMVEKIQASWSGPPDAPTSFAAAGRVSGLQLAAGPVPVAAPSPAASTPRGNGTTREPHPPGRPGISGATIDFEVTDAGGKAKVVIQGGAIEFPGVFDEPRVPFEQLQADAAWKHVRGSTELQLRNLQFANADAQGEAQVAWRRDADALGIVDLQGTLSRANGARVHRYLPLVLPEPVRRYVREAVVEGSASDVKFKVRGPVAEIPFANPARGEFRITANVAKGRFDYVPAFLQPEGIPPWPGLTDLSAELVFMRNGMEVNGATAKVAGLPGLQVTRAEAKITDFRATTVEVQTEIKGPLADALGFVNTSPVGNFTSKALAQTTATGTGDYRFKLTLPIAAIARSRVEGTVALSGNDVQFSPGTPPLGGLTGLVAITERGFNVAGAQARALGGELRFEGGTRGNLRADPPEPEAGVMFKAQGTVTSDGLRQVRDMDALARLAQNMNGSSAYTATLGFRRGATELSVASSLQGMALTLPAPLTKPADASLPLRFETALLPDSLRPGQPLQDQIALQIGKIVAVRYVRDVSVSNAPARVIRGGIGVGAEAGEAAPIGDSGVVANVNLARVDLDAWEKVLAAVGAPPAPVAPVAALPPVQPLDTVARSAAVSAAQSYLPTSMAIRAGELRVQGRQLNNVVVGGSREGATWRANVDATELNGYVEFRQAGAGPGRVYARLARLVLAPGTATEVEAILNEQPTTIPALDIVVEDMELRGKKLGRVEIEAINRGGGASASTQGAPREWRLNRFNVIMPEAVLTATGNWAAAPADGVVPAAAARSADRRRTTMNFTLDVSDSGELLKRFGMADLVRRGKGKLEGQVNWDGSPLGLDYPTLGGQFSINMESGQFVKADPGIAKLLGVLSLQSLPRRLTLDFRDVFSEGFAFDFVRGDVSIDKGIARTNNLQMRGVNAAVLMDGSADISRETQDVRVVVVPEINAGTASLIATAINPAIGLGTFLAQMFLRRPMMEAATQEFHIDGNWTDPKITKVERRTREAGASGQTPSFEARP
jgi:uncharacterized protein (TIGR02099 family)